MKQIPSFTLRAKEMGDIEKFVNLAYIDKHLLKEFSSSNGTVTLIMVNGNRLSGHLKGFRT